MAASVDPDQAGDYTKELVLSFSAEVDLSAGEDAMILRSLSLQPVA